MIERFAVSELPATPWKNGGGTTQEIAAYPSGSDLDSFLWRVSIATIGASGPFSIYRDIDRSIMLLDGDGVRLHSADGAVDHRLGTPYKPFAFSGDIAIEGTMLGGTSRDFNVMSRRGRGIARLDVITEPMSIEHAPCGVALCLSGIWQIDDDDLGEGEGLRWLNAASPRQFTPMTKQAALALAIWRPA